MLNEFGFTAGARLARAREAMGLSIADVAMQTRIRDRHLLALETGDFAALPGRTYIVGFARSYARVVGLNEGEIAAAMTSDYLGRTSQAEAPPAPAFAPGDPARVPSSRYAWLAAAIVAIVGIGGFAYWQTSNSPTATLPSLIPADRPVVVASAPAVTAVAPASVGPVVFTALGDAVWVEFYDGAGHQLLQKQLVKGETYTVPADAQDPKIRTGRPDLLAITIGGQAVPKLAEQQQLVKDVAVSAPALLARATPVAAASAASALPASGAPIPGAMAPVPAVAPTVHKAARTYRPHVGTPTNDGAASAAPVAVVSPSTVAQ